MIKIVNKDGMEPIFYETSKSAGFDIKANEAYVLRAGERGIIPTGLYLEEDAESDLDSFMSGEDALYELQIRPRSGLAAKYGVTVLNSPGTVDQDYRNEIKVILLNTSKEDFNINRGDRIAQGVVSRVYRALGVEVKDAEREGGFGSTGK
jgi:dUTP pyrophosphatase